MKKKQIKWKNLGSNYFLQGKGYYISYNPNTNSTPMGNVFNLMGGIIGGLDTSGQPETALVLEKKSRNEYLVLNGDFRKEYEKCKSLKEAMNVFKKNERFKSNWSTK